MEIGCAIGVEAADEAFLHERFRPERGGEEAVLEGHLVLDAGGRAVGRGNDGFGLLDVARERLVAVDVLAGLERSHGGGAVRHVGRADVDDVHVGVLDHAARIGEGVGVSAVLCRALRGVLVRRAHGHQADARRRRVVEERQAAIGVGVDLGDEAIADHAHAKLGNAVRHQGRLLTRGDDGWRAVL